HVAGAIDLRNLRVLEIGCGRGGGASFVARYLQPDRIVGVDISPAAVELCRRNRASAQLNFEVGDAEHLPFGEGEFDAVINVESSHCYPNLQRFFAEARRVLKPGGHFLYADLHAGASLDDWRSTLVTSGLHVVSERCITKNVLAALDRDNERKL